jgi:hypothetical protein
MGLFDFFKKKKEPPKEELQERRMLPRWKVSTPAKVKYRGSDAYIACEVKDLNMKGCALALEEKIPEGTVGLGLYFNDRYFFDIEIEVAWHKEADNKQFYGVRFTRVRDSDKEKMFLMMRENFPNQLWGNIKEERGSGLIKRVVIIALLLWGLFVFYKKFVASSTEPFFKKHKGNVDLLQLKVNDQPQVK